MEELYDSDIEDELEFDGEKALEIIATKTPADSLLWVFDPDMTVASITGNKDVYTSPEKTMYKVLEYMNKNPKDSIEQMLRTLDLTVVINK